MEYLDYVVDEANILTNDKIEEFYNRGIFSSMTQYDHLY